MSQGEDGGPDVEAIREILMEAAVARAASTGRHFGPSASQMVQTLVEQAALEIYNPTRWGQRSEEWAATDYTGRIAEGRRAVEKLVDTMAATARGLAGYEPDRLGEVTVTTAMSSGFCPCWPFC